MKKVYKGTVEGNIIRLDEKACLSVGTQTIVTLKTINNDEEQEEIKNRQLKLLDKGFYLGEETFLVTVQFTAASAEVAEVVGG